MPWINREICDLSFAVCPCDVTWLIATSRGYLVHRGPLRFKKTSTRWRPWPRPEQRLGFFLGTSVQFKTKAQWERDSIQPVVRRN